MSLESNMATPILNNSMLSNFYIHPNIAQASLTFSSDCCRYSSFKLQ